MACFGFPALSPSYVCPLRSRTVSLLAARSYGRSKLLRSRPPEMGLLLPVPVIYAALMSQSPEEPKIKFPGPITAAPPEVSPAHAPYDESKDVPLTDEEKQELHQYEPNPGTTKPIQARLKEACRLRVAGMTVTKIAEQLGYNRLYLYTALRTPRARAEMSRFADRMFEADVMTRLKALGPSAVDVIEELINDPAVSALKKADKAQWIIEKLSGKARQEVGVESNTLAAFMEVARQMQQRGETLTDIDVTPQRADSGQEERPVSALAPASTESKFSKWVDDEI